MDKSLMQATIRKIRRISREMGETLAGLEGSPWYPLQDSEFWQTLDEIERIGESEDESGVAYLIDHILIDDLEPMGRRMMLSQAALVAISQIPQAAWREIFERAGQFDLGTTRFHKIGWCLLMEAAGLTVAIAEIHSLMDRMVDDSDQEIHKRAVTIRSEMLGETKRDPDEWCFWRKKSSSG